MILTSDSFLILGKLDNLSKFQFSFFVKCDNNNFHLIGLFWVLNKLIPVKY